MIDALSVIIRLVFVTLLPKILIRSVLRRLRNIILQPFIRAIIYIVHFAPPFALRFLSLGLVSPLAAPGEEYEDEPKEDEDDGDDDYDGFCTGASVFVYWRCEDDDAFVGVFEDVVEHWVWGHFVDLG